MIICPLTQKFSIKLSRAKKECNTRRKVFDEKKWVSGQTPLYTRRMHVNWRTIKEFPDYEVSDKGLVRRKADGFIFGFSPHRKTRAAVRLRNGKKTKHCLVNRLVAEAWVDRDRRIGYDYVEHIDGDFRNCSANNLRWGPYINTRS